MEKEINWGIDPSHSEIAFRIKHLMITNIKGEFKKYQATITTQGRDFLTAQIDVKIDVDSIDTGDDKRDAHLKGEDFFDTQKFSEITFANGRLEKGETPNEFDLIGDLTIKGITQRVCLTAKLGGMAEDHNGKDVAGFAIRGNINRRDWGLNWTANVAGGTLVLGEEVKIICEIELFKIDEMKNTLKAAAAKELVAE